MIDIDHMILSRGFSLIHDPSDLFKNIHDPSDPSDLIVIVSIGDGALFKSMSQSYIHSCQ